MGVTRTVTSVTTYQQYPGQQGFCLLPGNAGSKATASTNRHCINVGSYSTDTNGTFVFPRGPQ
eukprot:6246125-Karenia_brevis.AAC.1